MVHKANLISRQLTDKWQYYLVSVMYLVTYFVTQYYGIPQLMVFGLYALIPLLDSYWKLDKLNPSIEDSKVLQEDLSFKLPLYVAVFSDWAYLFWALKYITTVPMDLLSTISLCLISASFASSNINVGHELYHKDNGIDKWVGTFTLSRNLYMHFAQEHVFGHHRNVSTPNDPASAARGQNVYNFCLQSVIGTFKAACAFEAHRIKGTYKVQSAFNYHNKIIWYELFQLGLLYSVYLRFGGWGVYYFIIFGFGGSLLLECVNYLEHYGLRRKEVSKGVYEPVDIRHSWNAPNLVSNALLFKLQRHSDHHENPYKPYQTLCTYDQSPTLPHGYPMCVLMTLFPSTWYNIIHEQLDGWAMKNYRAIPTVQKKVDVFVQKSFLFFLSTILIRLFQITHQ